MTARKTTTTAKPKPETEPEVQAEVQAEAPQQDTGDQEPAPESDDTDDANKDSHDPLAFLSLIGVQERPPGFLIDEGPDIIWSLCHESAEYEAGSVAAGTPVADIRTWNGIRNTDLCANRHGLKIRTEREGHWPSYTFIPWHAVRELSSNLRPRTDTEAP